MMGLTEIIAAITNNELTEKHQDEFSINELDDNVNRPFYRNSCGYKAKVENNKIKKLVVHFYMPECI